MMNYKLMVIRVERMMTTANEYTNANFECKYSNVNYCSNVRSGNNTDGHKQTPMVTNFDKY